MIDFPRGFWIYLKRANDRINTQELNNFAEGKGFLASIAASQ